jgi:hypothetical protein
MFGRASRISEADQSNTEDFPISSPKFFEAPESYCYKRCSDKLCTVGFGFTEQACYDSSDDGDTSDFSGPYKTKAAILLRACEMRGFD